MAFLVAVVPGIVRWTGRDAAQRVQTDAPTVERAADVTDQADPEPTSSAPGTDGDGAGSDDFGGLWPADDGLLFGEVAASVGVISDPSVDATGDGATDTTAGTTADTGATGTTDPTGDGAADGSPAAGQEGDRDDDGTSPTTVVGGPATTSEGADDPSTTEPVTTIDPDAEVPEVLYVDGGTGMSGNPGTEAEPLRRPIEALGIAGPGTTIFIRGGTYDTAEYSGFSIRRSGTADAWIRITNYPGERVVLTAGGEYDSGFEVIGASYVEVSGLVLQGRDDSIHGSGIFVKDGSHDVRIIGNQISNFGGAGISVIGSSRVHIEGNDVRNNAMRSFYQGSGISLYRMSGPTNSGHTNIIRGNYVVNNRNEVNHHLAGRITDGNCIILDRNNESNYTGWTLIENNVCAENGGRGIHSYRASYIEARNNTLYHNLQTDSILHGRGEMTVGAARDVYFYNNLVINRPGIAAYVDNRNTNVRFVNNLVAAGPPPGTGNQLLDTEAIFAATVRGGPVDQFRPVESAGLGATADPGNQAASDLSGRTRPETGAVGAFEP
ncbi:MAG: right-handed parallel beta-helix repeat-containing protein [Actinomycetota bacterium]